MVDAGRKLALKVGIRQPLPYGTLRERGSQKSRIQKSNIYQPHK
ncbi:hypothetical protein [Nostoc sp.]